MARKWDEGYEGFSGFKDDDDDEIVPDNPESLDHDEAVEVPRVNIASSLREIIDWHFARCRNWKETERRGYMQSIRELYSTYPGQESWDAWLSAVANAQPTRSPHTSTWFDD